MEEKQDIQNLSWGIERVNLHSPDHTFVSEKHEHSVATVPNKKKILHLGHCRYKKHVSNFFLMKFSKIMELLLLYCNTNLPQWVKNPEKNNHFYVSNCNKYVALDKIFSEIIIFNEGYQLFKFVPG